MKKKVNIILLIIFMILMIGSGFFIVSWMLENKETENIRDEEAKYLVNDSNSYLLDPKIFKDNKDTIGWLIVDGTNINYPVVQHSNNDYYLEHDFKHNYNSAGWVFMDYKNNLNDQNLVIYGHHRHDNSMFGSIDMLFDENFYKKNNNNEIILVTQKEIFEYSIFSVYKTSTKNKYNKLNFDDISKNIDILKNKSEIDFGEVDNKASQIITLSTCHANNKDRLVVHGFKKNR